MTITEREKRRRKRVAHDLAMAAHHLRIYYRDDLARQLDEVADGVYTGHIVDRRPRQ